jgi:tetratricopeptide (TPR) repeat protein
MAYPSLSSSLKRVESIPSEEKKNILSSASSATHTKVSSLHTFQNHLFTITRKIFALPTPFDWTFVEDHISSSFSPLSSQIERPILQHWQKYAGKALTFSSPLIDKNNEWASILLQASQGGDFSSLVYDLEKTQAKLQYTPPIFARQNQKRLNAIIVALNFLHIPSSLEHASRYTPIINDSEPDTLQLQLLPVLLLIKQKLYSHAISRLQAWKLHEKQQEKTQPAVLFLIHYKLSVLYDLEKNYEHALAHAASAAKIAQEHYILNDSSLVSLWLQTASFAIKAKNIRHGLSSCSHAKKHLLTLPKSELHMRAQHILGTLYALDKRWNLATSHIQAAGRIAISLSLWNELLSEMKALSHIASFHGKWRTALKMTQQLRNLAIAQQNTPLSLAAGLHIVHIYEHHKLWKHAEDLLEKLVPEASKFSSAFTLVEILHKLAVNRMTQGAYDTAAQALDHASAVSFTLKEKPELFQTSCHLTALLNVRMNRITIADFWFERAKLIAKEPNNNLAAILSNTGYLRFRQGKEHVAFDKWKKAQHLYKRNKTPEKIAHMQTVIERLQRGKPSANPGTNLTEPGPLRTSSEHFPPYPLNDFAL